MTTIQLKKNPIFEKPQWSKPQALPGEEVELQVNAQDLLPDQSAHFEIRDAGNQIVAVFAADGSQKKKWPAPNPPAAVKFHFYALLREKPSPKNGHTAVVQRLKSGELEVKGAKLSIVKMDEAFVPKQEKLELKYKLEGTVPAKGRIEVWGERYPLDKPLYTEEFTPAIGEKEWKTWDGKSNDGKKYLNSQTADAYLTPEFSPYRVRIIVGPDDDSVKEPLGKGIGKVAITEKQFAVEMQAVRFTVPDGLAEAATEDKYKQASAFMVPFDTPIEISNATNSSPIVITTKSAHGLAEKDEVRILGVLGNLAANGNFVVRLVNTSGDATSPTKFTLHKDKKFTNVAGNGVYTADTGKVVAFVKRVPLENEEARIRIPGARHTRIGDSLNQGKAAKHEDSFVASSNGPEVFTLTGGRKILPADIVQVYVKPGSWTLLNAGYSQVGNTQIRLDAGSIVPNREVFVRVSPGGHNIEDPYMADNDAPLSGAGKTKKEIDKPIYTRPELPLELEPRLRSRDSAKNKDGLFEKTAVGPLLLELRADDAFLKRLYTTAGTPESRNYFTRATTRCKKGVHDKPVHDSSNKPITTHWLARFVITADDRQEFNVSTTNAGDFTDPAFAFKKGGNELVVYLNRARLLEGTSDECNKGQKDYEEVDDKSIKLRKGLTKKDDVLWIARKDTSATEAAHKVDDWWNFPLGLNCHKHYGGIRGEPPTDELLGVFRKDFSASAGGTEPIIGKVTGWPYKDFVNLDPFKLDAKCRESIEVQAITKAGDQQGLAGVLFSPSLVAGDSYIVTAHTHGSPYARDFGCVLERPVPSWTIARTGPLTVWRLLRISHSYRMPPKGTGGLAASVGEEDPVLKDRPHPGDGRYMDFAQLLKQGELAFNDWEIDAPGALGTEPHRNVDLGVYRAHFNAMPTADGYYNIADASKVTNYFVRWDHYRQMLPPNLNRPNIASWAVSHKDAGETSKNVMDYVKGEIDTWNATEAADGADAGGAPVINVSPDTPNEYKAWALRQCMNAANTFMDTLMTQDNAPKSMKLIRWPYLYWNNVWYDGKAGDFKAGGLGVAGYCRGSGQAFFFTQQGNPDTFEHELGHSLHLIHFAAGGKTNFGWKHHDHAYPHCLMGYNSGTFTVPLPDTKVGSAITIATSPRKWFCPKCLLKLRGWDELVLPCNWEHPDVF